jgi:hypothetical protein
MGLPLVVSAVLVFRSPSHELMNALHYCPCPLSIFLSSLSHPNQTTDRQTPHLKRCAPVNHDWLKLAHLLSRVIRIRPRKPWLSFLSFPYLDLDSIASSSPLHLIGVYDLLRVLGFCCCSSAALPCGCLDRAPGSESSTSALGTSHGIHPWHFESLITSVCGMIFNDDFYPPSLYQRITT